MVRAGNDVGHDFGLLGIWDTRFQNADDRCRSISQQPAAEVNRLAEDARVLPESVAPETIGDNNDASSLGTVVLRSDETTENGMQPHDIEVAAPHDPRLHFAGLAQAQHGETEGREIAER